MCTCCGLTDIHNLTKDHPIPLSRGWKDTPDQYTNNIGLRVLLPLCGEDYKCTLELIQDIEP